MGVSEAEAINLLLRSVALRIRAAIAVNENVDESILNTEQKRCVSLSTDATWEAAFVKIEVIGLNIVRLMLVDPPIFTRRAFMGLIQAHREKLEKQEGPCESRDHGWSLKDGDIRGVMLLFEHVFTYGVSDPVTGEDWPDISQTPKKGAGKKLRFTGMMMQPQFVEALGELSKIKEAKIKDKDEIEAANPEAFVEDESNDDDDDDDDDAFDDERIEIQNLLELGTTRECCAVCSQFHREGVDAFNTHPYPKKALGKPVLIRKFEDLMRAYQSTEKIRRLSRINEARNTDRLAKRAQYKRTYRKNVQDKKKALLKKVKPKAKAGKVKPKGRR